MAKFIGVKMVEAVPMTAREANDKGHRIGNHSFEVHGQAACVKPENFDLNVGSNYARIKAEDKIWEGLGFVLQWAKYGLKK
nr:MAG: hypothetical protein [Bacteriophage sp.]